MAWYTPKTGADVKRMQAFADKLRGDTDYNPGAEMVGRVRTVGAGPIGALVSQFVGGALGKMADDRATAMKNEALSALPKSRETRTRQMTDAEKAPMLEAGPPTEAAMQQMQAPITETVARDPNAVLGDMQEWAAKYNDVPGLEKMVETMNSRIAEQPFKDLDRAQEMEDKKTIRGWDREDATTAYGRELEKLAKQHGYTLEQAQQRFGFDKFITEMNNNAAYARAVLSENGANARQGASLANAKELLQMQIDAGKFNKGAAEQEKAQLKAQEQKNAVNQLDAVLNSLVDNSTKLKKQGTISDKQGMLKNYWERWSASDPGRFLNPGTEAETTRQDQDALNQQLLIQWKNSGRVPASMMNSNVERLQTMGVLPSPKDTHEARLGKLRTFYTTYLPDVKMPEALLEKKALPKATGGGKQVVRTGTSPDGRKVVQYSDGSVEYR